MKRNIVHVISVFILVFLTGSSLLFSMGTAFVYAAPSTSASSTNTSNPINHKIRVAQIDLSNFYEYDRYGPIGGYGFEYLEEIANYTGWNYEFVPATWSQALEMLEKGELDLIAPAPRTLELEKKFSFSTKEVGLDYSVLCVAVENKNTAYNDFTTFDGMKVGLLSNSHVNKNFDMNAKENNFSVQKFYFENQASLLKALHDGKLDAILVSSLEKRPTERVIAKFSPTPYYFITQKGNSDILDPLNKALGKIKENNPYFDYDLQKKYYNWEETTVPLFTAEEKEFIKNAGPLKTVYDPAWAPIEYYDEETGTFSGINSDIFKMISDMTGLKFSYIKTSSYAVALDKITNGKVEILTGIDNDVNWANQHHLKLTDSYLTASIVLVKNKKARNLDTATFALAKDYLAATEYVKKSNPNAKIKYYDTPQDCFEAVNSGKADITYANSYVTEKILDNPKLNKLTIVDTVNLSDHLCIGVSNSANPILLSILNKSIHNLNATQLNNIIFKHTLGDNLDVNLDYFLYQKPQIVIGFLLMLFLVTTIVLSIMIKNRNRYNDEIKKVAYLDGVTGTDNYIKFKLDAENLLKNNKGRPYAVVYIDIYKFSYINDTFGYQAGDVILAEVSKKLNQHLGDFERAARISADNFVCLLGYESDKAIVKRGNAFQQQCNDHLASINNRFRVQFTSAIYKLNLDETDIPSLVGKAEIAHKTIGDVQKSPIVFYDLKIQNDFLRKKKLESYMSAALENEEFQIYLQPKFNMISNKIVGTEALVRWQHPSEGLIQPDQFIPLFESNGFILEMDFYVYETVCCLLRKWIDAGKPAMPVSVNVSKAHLATERFASQLKALVEKYDIPPRLLELELTESIFIDDSQEVVSLIQQLKDLGFTILIDDFGSGYSSLNLLKDLHVDILKLDKEFFRKDGMGEKDKIIVDGIIRIAHDLNMKIISEGIETQEQVDFLTHSGCRMAQGYFFAKPMTIKDFDEMIIVL